VNSITKAFCQNLSLAAKDNDNMSKRSRNVWLLLATIFGGWLLLGRSEAATPSGAKLHWKKGEHSVALLNGEQIVWQHNHDPQEGKPYIHPLATIEGEVLSALRPADHRWHRAIWWSWKAIDGVNYWEEDKSGRSKGITTLRDVKVTCNSDFSARLLLDLAYHPPEQMPVLTEKRLLVFAAPDERGSYHVDWNARFTATTKDVVLNQNSYGGMAARLAAALRPTKDKPSWQFTSDEGHQGEKISQARWVNFSGPLGSGRTAGLAIFVHPDSPRQPHPWRVIPHMPYFNPAFTGKEDYTLPSGKSITLRYRILVHDGSLDKEALEKHWQHFAAANLDAALAANVSPPSAPPPPSPPAEPIAATAAGQTNKQFVGLLTHARKECGQCHVNATVISNADGYLLNLEVGAKVGEKKPADKPKRFQIPGASAENAVQFQDSKFQLRLVEGKIIGDLKSKITATLELEERKEP
jgi:hypothetical protein